LEVPTFLRRKIHGVHGKHIHLLALSPLSKKIKKIIIMVTIIRRIALKIKVFFYLKTLIKWRTKTK
jgi:hypothetical protein